MAYTAYAAAGRAWAMIVEAVVFKSMQLGRCKRNSASKVHFIFIFIILGVVLLHFGEFYFFIFCGGAEGFYLV